MYHASQPEITPKRFARGALAVTLFRLSKFSSPSALLVQLTNPYQISPNNYNELLTDIDTDICWAWLIEKSLVKTGAVGVFAQGH